VTDLRAGSGASARNRDPDAPHGYWPRQRIQDRLKVLMAQLIEDETPDQIVIVSHSQGTVIALDVIDAEARNWIRPGPRGVTLELVTMGSPYTHLYTTYFPASFKSHRSRKNLWPMPPDAGSDGGVLNAWNNIFRVDDFVGTYIDASGLPADGTWPDRQWPREHAVPKNGHTMYWTDDKVAEILRPLLAAS
jgi:pimeloyl-ACP methyl ester carboxylesterase